MKMYDKIDTKSKVAVSNVKAVVTKASNIVKDVVKSAKYLAGDNNAMPEGVKKYREARGFRKY